MSLHLVSQQLNVIINHVGAEISSIKDKKGLEYIWQADQRIWPRHAPVLFPIVGRLKDDAFFYENKTYRLGQHGFARDLSFNLVEKSETTCCFELKSGEQTRKKYPFEFVLRIAYRLEGSKVYCFYDVVNPSTQNLPFSIGSHPAFNCPIETGGEFEDFYLEFDSQNIKQLLRTKLENGLRTEVRELVELSNGRLFLKSELFDQDALVFEGGQVSKVSLQSKGSAHRIHIECKDWPYFGVWTKKGSSRFICLEPWHGVADRANAAGDLTQKDGIMILRAGERFNCSFSIEVD